MEKTLRYIELLLLSVLLVLSCEQPSQEMIHANQNTDNEDAYVDIPGVPYIPRGVSGEETDAGIIKDPKIKTGYIRNPELKPDVSEISMEKIAFDLPAKDFSQLTSEQVKSLHDDAIAWIKKAYALYCEVTVEISKDESEGTFEIVAYSDDLKHKFRWYQFSDQTWTAAYDFWPEGQGIEMRVQQFKDSRSWYPRILNTGSLIGNMLQMFPLLENVATVDCLVESDIEDNIIRDEYWMLYRNPSLKTKDAIKHFYGVDKFAKIPYETVTELVLGDKTYHVNIQMQGNGDLRVQVIWVLESDESQSH